MKCGGFRAAIYHDEFDKNIFDVGLGILDEHGEVTIFCEYAGVHQFEFGLSAVATAVFGNQGIVRKFRLGIFVQHLHVAVGWRGIQVEVIFFYILAMISLMPGTTEEPLLQDMIATVPHGQTETNHLMTVADASDTVFAPSIGARSGVVM